MSVRIAVACQVEPRLRNNVSVMNLSEGFQVEEPAVFIPWGAAEESLRSLLPKGLRTVTTGYFTTACTSLGGLKHVLGFHMSPRKNGRLHELEFFRQDPRDSSDAPADLARGFGEWQHHLELTFGPPTTASQGDLDLPSYMWNVGPAVVRHFCQYRFGPEQHVRIARY
jgi:hypothetical protein